MSDDVKILEDQLRECYGRVVYSHKTHEKCADILVRRHDQIKLWQIVLSAIVTGGIISTLIADGTVGMVISAVLSTLLLVLNAYTKNYDLGEIAQKHRRAAADLWIIREEYLSLLTDIRIGDVPLDILRERRDKLVKELHATYAGAPSTNYKAYRAAQKSLKQLEDMTFSDEEINSFLPEKLKK